MRTALFLLLSFIALAACNDEEDGQRFRSDTGAVAPIEQRSGDAEAGYRALLNEPYVSCGIPYDAYRQLVPEDAATPALPGREGRNAELPYAATAHVVVSDLEEAAAIRQEDSQLAGVPAVVVARAAISCADGRPIEAAADLEDCSAMLGSADPTDQLEVLIWLAGAEMSVGRTKRARRWLESAERLVERLGGSEWHSGRLRAIEDRMGPATQRNGRDPGLTRREERILGLLSATHLSQREIARELGVSFNTIKSHVKSIYVKLGATSREEATQIARNHGLV